MQVKEGQRWVGTDMKAFTVISRTETNGEVWIHYRNDRGQEFSCWEESFVQRFRKDESWNGNRYL